MFFLISYCILSVLISYFFTKFSNINSVKYFLFFFSLPIFLSFWFKYPGSSDLAPIIYIFILEASVLESNGIERLIRPLGVGFVISTLICILISFFKSKN